MGATQSGKNKSLGFVVTQELFLLGVFDNNFEKALRACHELYASGAKIN